MLFFDNCVPVVLHYFHALCFFGGFCFFKDWFLSMQTHCLFLGCLHYSWIVVHVMFCVINIKWNIELCRLLPLWITPLQDTAGCLTPSHKCSGAEYIYLWWHRLFCWSWWQCIWAYIYIYIYIHNKKCGRLCAIVTSTHHAVLFLGQMWNAPGLWLERWFFGISKQVCPSASLVLILCKQWFLGWIWK